jgi:hypothetical protein
MAYAYINAAGEHRHRLTIQKFLQWWSALKKLDQFECEFSG